MSAQSVTNRLLLDTHTLIWYADQSPQMPVTTRALLDASSSALFVSVLCFWEIAMLTNLQRLALKPNLAQWIDRIRQGNAEFLSITDAHLLRYAGLPLLKDHRDPFDRLLIAQALTDDLTLVSRDGKFRDYAGLKSQWN